MTDTVKADAESVLKEIEDFFEHIFHHTHSDNHAALMAAKEATVAAVMTTPPVAGATGATASGGTASS